MDERVVKFRVGVMVLSTMIIAGILVLLFGDARSLVRGSYTIYIHFTDAPGVTEGTPVRKSGILIGRVHKVEFAKQGGVIVEAKIDGNVKLYRNEVPQVTGSLLGGDVVIQFVRRGTAPTSSRCLPPAGNPEPIVRRGRDDDPDGADHAAAGRQIARASRPRVWRSSPASSSRAPSRPMPSRSSPTWKAS